MPPLQTFTVHEQVVSHLRDGIKQGRWKGVMPGRTQLARELEVGPMTIVRALASLEREGVLSPQGTGRGRQIMAQEEYIPPVLKVTILLYNADSRKQAFVVDLQHRLLELGFSVEFAPHGLIELRMNARRVAQMVRRTKSEAWVILAGSHDILTWFASQPVPAFALFGHFRGISIAATGPDKVPAIRQAIRRLTTLGHRRIVLLVRDDRRKPTPGYPEVAFLKELAAQGIPTDASYNLPDWRDHAEAFRECLDSLFQLTPPTALIIDGAPLFHAAMQHLALKGIIPPRDVSLICTDDDPTFAWSHPQVARISLDSAPWVRRVVRWTQNIALGKDDRRQSFSTVKFIDGGTVGPVPAKRSQR